MGGLDPLYFVMMDITLGPAAGDYDVKKNFDFKPFEIIKEYTGVRPGARQGRQNSAGRAANFTHRRPIHARRQHRIPPIYCVYAN